MLRYVPKIPSRYECQVLTIRTLTLRYVLKIAARYHAGTRLASVMLGLPGFNLSPAIADDGPSNLNDGPYPMARQRWSVRVDLPKMDAASSISIVSKSPRLCRRRRRTELGLSPIEFAHWLRLSFPHLGVRHANAGLPATSNV
jgi:hypothetical protein